MGLTIVYSLIGVLFGWFLNQVTSIINIYKSERVVFKETVFFLLELLAILSSLKRAEKGTSRYMDKVSEKFKINEEEVKNGANMMKEVISSYLISNTTSQLEEINENYEKAIIKLSSVDPITAYYLKGKSKTINDLYNYSEYCSSKIPSLILPFDQININALVQQTNAKVEDKVIEETLSDIRDIIISLSKKIGLKTYRSIKKMSIVNDDVWSDETDEKIEKIIDDILKPLIENPNV